MKPTIGRIVHYRLTRSEADSTNKRRLDWQTNGMHSGMGMMAPSLGYQDHVGNPVAEGEVVAMIITQVWPNEYGPDHDGVNGQAFLDGNDSLWVTSVPEGEGPGTWSWPPRA